MKERTISRSMLLAIAAVASMAAAEAQVRPTPTTSSLTNQPGDQSFIPPQQQTAVEANEPGRTARSSIGQVGQRQTQDVTATRTGIKPMGRITSRIQNRIQSRIRNRIDKNYDPQGNATDPFRVAEDQARTSGRPR